MAERKAGKLGRKLGVSAIGSQFKLADYLVDPLPVWDGPDDFTGGREDWGMLANGPDPLVTNQGPDFEGLGDCGVAGDYHKAMADAATAGETVPSIDGQVPNEIATEYMAYDGGQDDGVDLGQWLLYRMTHSLAGLPPIGGFAQVSDSGAEYQSAFHLFGGLYDGITVNQEMMDEFNQGVPWSSTDPNWIGGHAVPHLKRNAKLGGCCTWAAIQLFTWTNWKATREESYVIFTSEIMATPGGTFHGVNVAQLKADLASLHGTTV